MNRANACWIRIVFLILTVFLVNTIGAMAASNTWVGANQAYWDDPANWNPAAVPADNEVAFFPDVSSAAKLRYSTNVSGIFVYAVNVNHTIGVENDACLALGADGLDFYCLSGGASPRACIFQPAVTGDFRVLSHVSANPYVGAFSARLYVDGSLTNVSAVTVKSPPAGKAGLVFVRFDEGYAPPTNSVFLEAGAIALSRSDGWSADRISRFNTNSAGVLMLNNVNQDSLDLSNHTNLIMGAYVAGQDMVTLSGSVAVAESAPYRFGGTCQVADPRYYDGALEVTAPLTGYHDLVVDSGSDRIKTGRIIIAGTNNSFEGTTSVRRNGTLVVDVDRGLGLSHTVNVEAGSTLDLTNSSLTDAVYNGATINLYSSGSYTGKVYFGDASYTELISGLNINGMRQRKGTYTSANLTNWIVGAGTIEIGPRGTIFTAF